MWRIASRFAVLLAASLVGACSSVARRPSVPGEATAKGKDLCLEAALFGVMDNAEAGRKLEKELDEAQRADSERKPSFHDSMCHWALAEARAIRLVRIGQYDVDTDLQARWPEARALAARLSVLLGGDHTAVLRTLLDEKNWSVRSDVLEALVHAGDQETVDRLEAIARGSDPKQVDRARACLCAGGRTDAGGRPCLKRPVSPSVWETATRGCEDAKSQLASADSSTQIAGLAFLLRTRFIHVSRPLDPILRVAPPDPECHVERANLEWALSGTNGPVIKAMAMAALDWERHPGIAPVSSLGL